MKTGRMSYILIGLFVMVYLLELWVNAQIGGFNQKIGTRALVYLGANVPSVFMAGEYWRVLTSCFLHLDALHLFMNASALHYFGPMIERSFGPWKLLLGFLITGIAGSLASTLMHLQEPYLSAGASGGLYGLFGIIFVSGKRYAAQLPKGYQIWLNQTLGALILFSFLPSIDIWGHFGGLAAGLALGMLYQPLPPNPEEQAELERQARHQRRLEAERLAEQESAGDERLTEPDGPQVPRV